MSTQVLEAPEADPKTDETEIHIWCGYCGTEPKRSLCDQLLTGRHRPGERVTCQLCNDLARPHLESAHFGRKGVIR